MKCKVKIEEPERLHKFIISHSQGHSEDFRALCLKLLEQGGSVSQISELTGIGESTLYEWVSS